MRNRFRTVLQVFVVLALTLGIAGSTASSAFADEVGDTNQVNSGSNSNSQQQSQNSDPDNDGGNNQTNDQSGTTANGGDGGDGGSGDDDPVAALIQSLILVLTSILSA